LVISAAPEGAVVERVVIGGPAWQVGVRIGDVIVALDGRLLAGVPMLGIAQRLRGPIESEVEMTLRRAGQRELMEVKPKRAVLPPPRDVNAL
jgi:carboxyl-terminal processing protease